MPTAQLGRLLLLYKGNSDGPPETFTKFAGFTSNGITMNDEMVEISNKDTDNWRAALSGAGIKSISASGSGTLYDADSALTDTVTDFIDNSTTNWALVVPGHGTYIGPFKVTSLELTGENNGPVEHSITCESIGAVTFTAAASGGGVNPPTGPS